VGVEIVYETHATSTDNEAGIATGWLDGELSATGRRQGLELGERRCRTGLAVVFTSDLARTVQTAEFAFAGSDLPIHRDQRLRECNYGRLNGTAARRRRPDDAPACALRLAGRLGLPPGLSPCGAWPRLR
jgi:broad specificity phosphatase PhoE